MIDLSSLQAPVPEESQLRAWQQRMLSKGIHPYSIMFALESLSFANDLADLSERFEFIRECPIDLELIPQCHRYWRSEAELWKDATATVASIEPEE